MEDNHSASSVNTNTAVVRKSNRVRKMTEIYMEYLKGNESETRMRVRKTPSPSPLINPSAPSNGTLSPGEMIAGDTIISPQPGPSHAMYMDTPQRRIIKASRRLNFSTPQKEHSLTVTSSSSSSRVGWVLPSNPHITVYSPQSDDSPPHQHSPPYCRKDTPESDPVNSPQMSSPEYAMERIDHSPQYSGPSYYETSSPEPMERPDYALERAHSPQYLGLHEFDESSRNSCLADDESHEDEDPPSPHI